MKIRFLLGVLIVLALSSCAVEVDSPTLVTPAPHGPYPPTAAISTGDIQQSNAIPSTAIPITWAHLHLTGRLVYTNAVAVDDVSILQVQILDLVSGRLTTIFEAPKDSWIYYIAVSPDNTQVLISYSPPSEDQFIDQDLYIMPLDGSQSPRLLFTPPTREDNYIEAEYSPDGKYLYFTHVNLQNPLPAGQVYPAYEIYRMTLPGGPSERIAENAYWPRPSTDSAYLAYVSLDLFSLWNNKLFIVDGDSDNSEEVSLRNPLPPDIIDAPVFSPNGQFILFSAPVRTESYQPNWLDKLMGVRVAKAHSNVASDWWSVPVNGGSITQLTNIQSSGLFASFSPDNQHVVSHSTDGIFVMNPDGSEITMLVPNPLSVPGTVRWIP